MKKGIIILIFLLILFTFSILSPVNSATVDLGSIELKSDGLSILNNNNAPEFVKKPSAYSRSPLFHKTSSQETKKNIIKTIKGNKQYTFTTEYFLPLVWDKKSSWSNVQSIAINKNYMYTVVSSGKNKGFIVRYDMKLLNKYNLNKEGKDLAKLRKLGVDSRDKKSLTKEQILIKKAIKVGPMFNSGHGQSLSFNPKTNSLWMWQDDTDTTELKLMSINMKTLKPSTIYKFSIKGNGFYVRGAHNLAFDNDGRFYFDIGIKAASKNAPAGSTKIYTGQFINNKLEIKLINTVIKNLPGTIPQSIAVNPITNKLYLISDGVFYTIPIYELQKGTLSKEDFEYTVLNTKREFEGIGFDEKGNSYLLVLRGVEILKSINS